MLVKKIIEHISGFFHIVSFSSYTWISISEPSKEIEIVSSVWENWEGR